MLAMGLFKGNDKRYRLYLGCAVYIWSEDCEHFRTTSWPSCTEKNVCINNKRLL